MNWSKREREFVAILSIHTKVTQVRDMSERSQVRLLTVVVLLLLLLMFLRFARFFQLAEFRQSVTGGCQLRAQFRHLLLRALDRAIDPLRELLVLVHHSPDLCLPGESTEPTERVISPAAS